MTAPGEILATIRNVLQLPEGRLAEPIALHEPVFGAAEKEAVVACIDSGWASTAGREVTVFEEKLQRITGAEFAIACVNGTAALHISLILAGVGPGDEVLVPAVSFVATANAVVYCGAVPHFVDIGDEDFGIDPRKLATYLESVAESRNGVLVNINTGRRIAALVPLHCFGYPCQINALVELADVYGLPVVEDAAEALGTAVNGKATGTFGALGALSFNGNKIVTSGGGGAVLTGDSDLAARARHITTTAKRAHPWAFFHDELGYNYRLPGINAALGIAQLTRLDDILARKLRLHEAYLDAFDGLAGVRMVTAGHGASPNHWLNTIVIDGSGPADRDRLLQLAHEQNILLRPAWDVLADLPYFSDAPVADISSARDLVSRTICLPSSEFLVEAIA